MKHIAQLTVTFIVVYSLLAFFGSLQGWDVPNIIELVNMAIAAA